MNVWRAVGRVTSLVRSIDLRYPSNRFALFAFAGVWAFGTIALVASGRPAGEAAGASVHAALSTFLAWAIARELDPDLPASARYAAFAAVAGLVAGPAELAAALALLATNRILVRTAGPPPTTVDLAGVVVIAGFAASRPGGLVPGIAIAAALLWDTLTDEERRLGRLAAAAAAVLVSAAAASWAGTLFTGWPVPTLAQVVLLGAGVVALARLRTEPPRSRADRIRARLSEQRLVAGRVATAATLVVAVLWAGGTGLVALAPGWAAVIGVWVGQEARERRRRRAATLPARAGSLRQRG